MGRGYEPTSSCFSQRANVVYSKKVCIFMKTPRWFDDIPVLGALPVPQLAAQLQAIGENEKAEWLLKEAQDRESYSFALPWGSSLHSPKEEPWAHTAHSFGYIAPAKPDNTPLPIRSTSSIPADSTLRQARLRITLDRFRVAFYPGGGMHRVLLHFYAQNQVPGVTEELHFNATYRVREGEHAAIQGYPIFVGLTVGHEGISFRCRTINVTNEQDEAFLGFLESDVFTKGLKLATIAQPAIGPLSAMALSVARMIATRYNNVSVQDFDLGLDFSQIPTRAPLAEGSYLAVQIPERLQITWNWDEWVYQRSSGLVVNKGNFQQTLPYNYLVFGVSRYEEGGLHPT